MHTLIAVINLGTVVLWMRRKKAGREESQAGNRGAHHTRNGHIVSGCSPGLQQDQLSHIRNDYCTNEHKLPYKE